ncbi:MAG: 30S ribosomal protein S20 [Deltaproteobacteria bacterium]
MANHASALKRARQAAKRNLRNRSRKTRVKNVVKEVEAAISRKAFDEVDILLRKAQKVIDKVSATGTIHRRTAARKISRLGKKVARLLSQRSEGASS